MSLEYLSDLRIAAEWIWDNGAVIGALSAAVLTAIYVWLTYHILWNGQTPVVTVQDFTRSGVLEGDHQLRSFRNVGQGAALNVCIHQKGLSPTQSEVFEWLGSFGPSPARFRRGRSSLNPLSPDLTMGLQQEGVSNGPPLFVLTSGSMRDSTQGWHKIGHSESVQSDEISKNP